MDPKADRAGQIMGLREFRGGPPVTIDPDTVLPAADDQIVWMHRNARSFCPTVFKVEHLESLLSQYRDPILYRTYDQRKYKTATCRSQNPIDAALLGRTDDALKYVTQNFTDSNVRFQAFWKHGYDWIPDLDNGGAGMQAL